MVWNSRRAQPDYQNLNAHVCISSQKNWSCMHPGDWMSAPGNKIMQTQRFITAIRFVRVFIYLLRQAVGNKINMGWWGTLLVYIMQRAPNVKSFKIQSCPERFDLYGDYIAQEGNARTLLSSRANNKYVSTHIYGAVPEVYKTNKLLALSQSKVF